MLKYLRIAVTALSLTACVLLVALWVRSYVWRDGVFIRPIVERYLDASSVRGRIAFMTLHYPTNPRMSVARWGATGHSVEILEDPWPTIPSSSLMGIWLHDGPNGGALSIPHSYLILTLITLAAVPWMSWSRRFSLRTLLIGTTLVAVVLGTLVAIARA